MDYAPLVNAWGRHGSASVLIGALEDAGFHPAIECDPRGWMHFYSWPFGSSNPITIWIPVDECEEAAAFLAADVEIELASVERRGGLFGLVSEYRRWIYASWLLGLEGVAASVVGIASLPGLLLAPSDESSESGTEHT